MPENTGFNRFVNRLFRNVKKIKVNDLVQFMR